MTDIPAGVDTTGTIGPGETVTGSIEVSGDHDWYRIDLNAGDVIRIALNGFGTDPVYDPYLALRNSAGAMIGGNDDSGGGPNQDALLVFAVPATGAYYLDASANFDFTGDYSLTVELADAVRSLGTTDSVYGWNATADTAGFDPAGDGSTFIAITDGGGIDTFDFSGFSTRQYIVLEDGYASTLGSGALVVIASGTVIENAIGGSGPDFLAGNEADNILDGGPGADEMDGGIGDDIYLVDNPDDAIFDGFGDNVIYSSVDYTLLSSTSTLILTGSAIEGRGDRNDDRIIGNELDNRLDGGRGADYLAGKAGDDSYFVDNRADQVFEVAGEGRDTIYSVVDFTLPDEVETLVLQGVFANSATGNASSNTLFGTAAANVLDGGAGADVMFGRGGDDSYYVDDALDRVGERSGQGTDMIYSSIDFRLPDNVENLTLIGTSTSSGHGNSLRNVLTGNSASNLLDGGAGADEMRGGAGNDIYLVENGGDHVHELAGEGIDTVRSSISYVLGTNVENVELRGAAIRATGNSLANDLRGTAEDNVLDGRGGADLMRGGRGDDIYFVDNSADHIVEGTNAGEDRVYSTVTYHAEANVENIYLRGDGAADAFGNSLDNVLRGNSAANVLTGGAGADDLRGGTGADTFVFRDGDFAGLTPSTSDRIIDFSHSEGDRIDLAQVDANAGLGGDQDFTFIGSSAFHDVAGELRYEIINGNTYVYGDTNGDGLADLMIRLDGSHALVSGDFIVG
jgi:Ca2+-binding RTX toxin-like protein